MPALLTSQQAPVKDRSFVMHAIDALPKLKPSVMTCKVQLLCHPAWIEHVK